MANIDVTICMNEDLKKQADALFADLGLSFDVAITLLVKHAVGEQRVPLGTPHDGITIATDEQIDKLSDMLIEKNIAAYKELAK